MKTFVYRIPLLFLLAASCGCMDRIRSAKAKEASKAAMRSEEGPARNQLIRRESLAKIDEALRSGAIDKKEYDRRKARIMDAYWQRENTRRHQSADSFDGSSKDRAISP